MGQRIDYSAAAEILGVGVGTLRSMVHRKQVPHIRMGLKLVRFDRDELEQWLRSRSVPANESR
jgi:excisionase family DNA binding protein